MKIAAWNVNSLRVRLPQVCDWLTSEKPDVLALQETKLTDDRFPADELEQAGYHAVYAGQPTYNGVAILSRTPAEDVIRDVPHLGDEQRRFIAATVGGVRVVNLYVVNGKAVGDEKYDYKLNWLDHVTRQLEIELQNHAHVVVLGDFNIAPDDRDVHDPEAWAGKILCSQPEREALQRILGLGFRDTFRLFDQPENVFSWWDYRTRGFQRGLGLRIDLVLASKALAGNCTESYVHREPRGWERPSDHAPVVAVFEMQ